MSLPTAPPRAFFRRDDVRFAERFAFANDVLGSCCLLRSSFLLVDCSYCSTNTVVLLVLWRAGRWKEKKGSCDGRRTSANRLKLVTARTVR